MVSLENPENQNLNAHFNFHLLNQCYQKVYQRVSISEIKRVYHYKSFSSLSGINTALKAGITITWSFTLRYVIATTSLWCWKEISYDDATLMSIYTRSTARWKSNKKPMCHHIITCSLGSTRKACKDEFPSGHFRTFKHQRCALNNGAQSSTEKSNVWRLKKRNISYKNKVECICWNKNKWRK